MVTLKNASSTIETPIKKRNYKPFIIIVSVILIGAIGILSGIPGAENFDAFDITILPMLNAIFNTFTFLFLVGALIAIKNGTSRYISDSFTQHS